MILGPLGKSGHGSLWKLEEREEKGVVAGESGNMPGFL